MKLSVCMIVKNEAKNIVQAISDALLVGDEVIIVDTGSTDETKQIAKEYGARVFDFEWCNDFSAARNYSIDQAKFDWVMWMDADDRIPVESAQKIIELKSRPLDSIYGFKLHNVNPVESKFTTDQDFLTGRMFPNRPDVRFEKILHEQVTPSALNAGLKLVPVDVVINHVGYQDPKVLREKMKRNSKLLLLEAGYPKDAVFYSFDMGEYFGYYAPNTLSVFNGCELIGACDPFDFNMPEQNIQRIVKIHERAKEIIDIYKKNKAQNEIWEAETEQNSPSVMEEIERMTKVFEDNTNGLRIK